MAILVACGRQVTPDRISTTGCQAQPGRMLIKYRTQNAMDFKNVLYTIVFNTSGNGQEPYANAYNTGYSNYSFVLVVDGTSGTIQTYLRQYLNVGGQISPQPVPYAPTQLKLTTNTDGRNQEFTIDFERALLNGILRPIPPTTAPQTKWNINFITTNPQSVPLNTLGTNGVSDTSFYFSIDTTLGPCQDQTVTVATGGQISGVPAANLAGGEFINAP